MRLTLVRHAVTAETGYRLSGRLPDIPLSDEGRRAACKVALRLADLEIDRVVSSPIQRCRETADVLAFPHGKRPQPVASLTEVEYGLWSGRPLKSLYRMKAWQRLLDDPAGFRFPEGETLTEVCSRVRRYVQRLAKTQPKSSILAVAHGDVVRALASYSLVGDVTAIHRIHVAPLGVSSFWMTSDGAVSLLSLNA